MWFSYFGRDLESKSARVSLSARESNFEPISRMVWIRVAHVTGWRVSRSPRSQSSRTLLQAASQLRGLSSLIPRITPDLNLRPTARVSQRDDSSSMTLTALRPESSWYSRYWRWWSLGSIWRMACALPSVLVVVGFGWPVNEQTVKLHLISFTEMQWLPSDRGS